MIVWDLAPGIQKLMLQPNDAENTNSINSSSIASPNKPRIVVRGVQGQWRLQITMIASSGADNNDGAGNSGSATKLMSAMGHYQTFPTSPPNARL